MKMINLLSGCVAATLLVAAGCSKSDKTPPAPEINGVAVDIPKLTEAFQDASSELKATATQASFNVR